MFAKFARIATTALAAAGLLAVAPSASANVNRATNPDVGVQFHGTWTRYTDAQRVDILDTLHAAGVTTVRIDVSWAMLQPVSGTSYDAWGTAFVDRLIALCNARGISPLVTLWLTPGWANNYAGLYVLPTYAADYARVALWAAARYTDKVAGWEVWNEENSPAFLVGADPVAYTHLLKEAYPAFHAGYAGTTVVFGGVEYNDDAWISRAYAAGAHGSFDVMATHPYMGMANLPPDTPDDSTKWTFTHAAAVHNLMVANGDGAKSLWFTEFGWSTHANRAATPNWDLGVSEAVQAQYLTATIALIRTAMPWVAKAYWYTGQVSTADDIGQRANYDVLRPDLSPKPIMSAISAATQ
jgi:polysaccharide biosynthesis protein PslG